jgi:hypothetical protein
MALSYRFQMTGKIGHMSARPASVLGSSPYLQRGMERTQLGKLAPAEVARLALAATLLPGAILSTNDQNSDNTLADRQSVPPRRSSLDRRFRALTLSPRMISARFFKGWSHGRDQPLARPREPKPMRAARNVVRQAGCSLHTSGFKLMLGSRTGALA